MLNGHAASKSVLYVTEPDERRPDCPSLCSQRCLLYTWAGPPSSPFRSLCWRVSSFFHARPALRLAQVDSEAPEYQSSEWSMSGHHMGMFGSGSRWLGSRVPAGEGEEAAPRWINDCSA